ncbi:MAG: UpxY family transcription antiterminator [Tannerella sp.]|jgi:transcription antitermination factor NusG|nr:UpxY family transcription antiterminator [Tannerella sp.]
MSNNNIHWYAAKVRYQTEKKIKKYLTEHGIEHYIPFHKVVIERNGRRKSVERPVISCFVFVHTDRKTALALPADMSITMNFIHCLDTGQMLVIPPKQMQDFMFVLDFSEETVRLKNTELAYGDRVRVIKGPFAGIEGELVRIKGHKRVVVRLDGILAVATTYIPSSFLEKV